MADVSLTYNLFKVSYQDKFTTEKQTTQANT